MANSSATAANAAASRSASVSSAQTKAVRRNSCPWIGVVELLVLDDVAAVLEQERGDRVDDAGTFGAAEGEDEGV